ncbi:glycosyltransferase [Microbacterium sp. MMO-10]|uniref:glycosyltransferase n=1 Tax=Microbacterium sp. MMO-10 TaxID=3081272 RepID=UPI0030164375
MTGIIVHEWLERFGGAENVVDRFAALYPQAPIQALWNDAPGRFDPARVHETWLARTPLRRRKALALPFQPSTWRHLGSADADWIVCSSHLFAHHARFAGTARDAPKHVYVHTPARYIWNPELDDRGRSAAVRAAAPALRAIDRSRAEEAASMMANSEAVRERIREHWGVDAGVIHPPVDVVGLRDPAPLSSAESAVLDGLPSEFLLGASRFVPYKRLDTVVRAGAAAGLPVVLAGGGPERDALVALAAERGVRIVLVDSPSRALLAELYRRSIAYVFPAVEDFGIMPVEAMATGTPVIGRTTGGVSESVQDGVSGVLIEDLDAFEGAEFRAALDRVAALDRSAVAARALRFDTAEFDRAVREWLPA